MILPFETKKRKRKIFSENYPKVVEKAKYC